MIKAAQHDKSLDHLYDFDGDKNSRTVEEDNKKSISFGTTLDRGLFPHICAPDRTGNELYPLKGAPHRGPGCYNNAEVSSFTYNLEKWNCSKRGYTCGARTDPRFRKVHQLVTPSPTLYQTNWTTRSQPKPAYKPFETSTVRFKQLTQDPEITPGPGIYEHEVTRNRQVKWPQQFGGPVKPIQPHIDRKTLKTELFADKEYRKFRNRVAYFRLYFE